MFCENLKQARTNKNMKQADVAELLGCAPTSLTNWENGKVQPSLDVLSRICAIYEISPLSLLEKEYSFDELAAISGKSVPERSYEEQIALNFGAPTLNRLLSVEAQRKETQRIEETAAFLQSTDMLNRFGGSMNKAQIKTVKAEYDENGTADNDILFAFHALTGENKRAFLSMLSGLLSDSANVQQFNENMDKATAFTLERLTVQRKSIK